MRLLTWNCCRGAFDRKVPLLDHLGYDIAVVQECARPASPNPSVLWVGDNPRQGIAIIAGPAYELRPLANPPELPRYVVPVQVCGPVSFFLLAVWTQQEPTYVEPAFRAAEAFAERIAAQPTVILGDFNSNAQWDRKRKPARDHSALVRYLEELGLVSSYHHWNKEPHGAESQPSFYFRWQESQPFHIDYGFVPRDWADRITRVQVGSYAEWKDASDHRPLLVELDLEYGSTPS
jgi:hypothetical protein